MTNISSPVISSHVRTWLQLRILCSPSGGHTLEELSEELGVSRKTVRRDLKELQAAGFPIQQSVGSHGRKACSCQDEANLTRLRFTFEEAAALYLGRQLLEPMAGTVFFGSAHAAFRKIRGALTKQYLEQLVATQSQNQSKASRPENREALRFNGAVLIQDGS